MSLRSPPGLHTARFFFLSRLCVRFRPTPHPRGFLARTRTRGASGSLARATRALRAVCPCVLSRALPAWLLLPWAAASLFLSPGRCLAPRVSFGCFGHVWFPCGTPGPRQPLSAPACLHCACCPPDVRGRRYRVPIRSCSQATSAWRWSPPFSAGPAPPPPAAPEAGVEARPPTPSRPPEAPWGCWALGVRGLSCSSMSLGHSVEPAVHENGEDAAEGREGKEAEPGSPRRCDIIVISGRKEKCEAAKEALEALVPVTIEVEVPFDLHRYIIGQKGSGIRKMMDEFEVNIHVPAPELQSDIIAITGLAAHLDRAKAGLLERVKELQAEQEDRALRSFKLSVTVDPKYHPKIIGRKGAVITQIRLEHDVNIQFPDKDDGSQPQDQITITGYEKNTEAARDAILKIVGELEQMVSEDVPLDHRVHARIIGARGKAIRKIMDEFKVDIRFPQSGAPDPNCVTVTGLPENVEEAIDHILNLEEEYLADVVDSEALQLYLKPPAHEESKAPSKGFVVRDAPWTASSSEKAPDMSSSEEFPSFGAQVAPKTLPWGPKR